MKNSFETLVENSKNAIRNWWLLLLTGVAILAMGVIVFIYPEQSYLGMSVIFGWLILFSGVSQIIVYATNRHIVTGRGWMLAGGIIETVLGLILIFSLTFSASILPLYLGFWLLFRSFSLIGLGSDLNFLSTSGGGWTIFTAIILLITSLIILLQPLVFGVEAVVIWVGISMLFAGISLIIFSLRLRTAHKAIEK